MLPVFFALAKSPYGFPSSMVPLRFMCDIALGLLVFLCIIGRSLQGCDDYLDNSTKFLKANFSPHQYIRLEGLSLNPARGTMNRSEVANCTTHQWCTQSGNISSHQCNIYKSCFNQYMNLAQTGCDSAHELYPQKMEMVSMLQLYCMVNIVKNRTDFPSECKEGEKIYVCTLKPTEKTESSIADNQGFIASNVVLVFLLVFLIVSNATWCHFFRRQRRTHQLWRAGHPCACRDQLLTEIPDEESRP
ncbi:unnamed protein product [Gadus morhua 'NCC']